MEYSMTKRMIMHALINFN